METTMEKRKTKFISTPLFKQSFKAILEYAPFLNTSTNTFNANSLAKIFLLLLFYFQVYNHKHPFFFLMVPAILIF